MYDQRLADKRRAEIEEEIEAASGLTPDLLVSWGLTWPAPRNWKAKLIREAGQGKNPADTAARLRGVTVRFECPLCGEPHSRVDHPE